VTPLGLAGWFDFLPALGAVSARLTGLMIAAPVFSSRAIPRRIKVLLTFTASLVLLPMVGSQLPESISLARMVAGWFGEMAVGAAFGMATNLLFLGVETFGEIVGVQAGITLAQVFNPLMEGSTSSSLSQLFSMITLGVFLAADGHLALTQAFLDSYQAVPPLTPVWDFGWIEMLFTLLGHAFELALRLAAPAMLVLLLAKTAIGFIGRTAPQFNIFAVGLPLQVMLGLFFVGSACLALDDVIIDQWAKWMDTLGQILFESRS
jgi:flagellar biosynthetic protein FliR